MKIISLRMLVNRDTVIMTMRQEGWFVKIFHLCGWLGIFGKCESRMVGSLKRELQIRPRLSLKAKPMVIPILTQIDGLSSVVNRGKNRKRQLFFTEPELLLAIQIDHL